MVGMVMVVVAVAGVQMAVVETGAGMMVMVMERVDLVHLFVERRGLFFGHYFYPNPRSETVLQVIFRGGFFECYSQISSEKLCVEQMYEVWIDICLVRFAPLVFMDSKTMPCSLDFCHMSFRNIIFIHYFHTLYNIFLGTFVFHTASNAQLAT